MTGATLEWVEQVPRYTNDSSPAFSFSSSDAGTLQFNDSSCSSESFLVVDGTNTFSLNALEDGDYIEDCALRVVGPFEIFSNWLYFNDFTIDTVDPEIEQVSPPTPSTVTTPNRPSVVISSSEGGYISFYGGCSVYDLDTRSSGVEVEEGDNELTVYYSETGIYDECTVQVVDWAGNESDEIDLSTFTVVVEGSGSGRSHAAQPPTVSFVQPAAGSSLTAGNSQLALWTTGGAISSTTLSFSSNGGSTWTVIAPTVQFNSYYWIIPAVATTTARLKVTVSGEGGSATAASGDFTIVVPAGTPPPSTDQNDGSATETGDSRGGVTSKGTFTRPAANAKLPPTVPVDTLVRVASQDTVYYIGLDAKRHPFPHVSMFHTWYETFGVVTVLDDDVMASIPMGAPILVRPGTKWVKIVSNPATYYVDEGYNLRLIQDEATAAQLWGSTWNTNILDVDPSFFTNFTMGSPITPSSLGTGWPAGALVKPEGSANDDVWYLSQTTRRKFAPGAFEANHFLWQFVRPLPATAGAFLRPIGTPVTGLEDALFSLMH